MIDDISRRVASLTADHDPDAPSVVKIIHPRKGPKKVTDMVVRPPSPCLKVTYHTLGEASRIVDDMIANGHAEDDTLTAYRCRTCDYFHVGHQRWLRQLKE